MALPTPPTVSRGDLLPNEVADFNKFVNPPTNGGLKEIDKLTPDVTFRRNLLVNFDLELPDMGKVPMWIIEDPDAPDAPAPLPKDALRRNFPSPAIRIPQGALVRADVNCQGNTHTIHWHGIEPTPMNDGVGHTSFEVSGHFFYQFQPRDAGTYFYHCHKNTVLHFEMGLYGALIVDPPDPAHPGVKAVWPTGGPGFAARFNQQAVKLTDHAIHYDVEAIVVPDSIDSRWHTLGHNAFMQKNDPQHPANPSNFSQDGILNDYRPDIFLLTGIPRRKGDPTPFSDVDNPLFGPLVAPKVKVGQTLLIRIINADYIIHRISLEIDAEVISADGRAFGVPPLMQYSRPYLLPAGSSFKLTSAMRNDLIVKPTRVGVYNITIEFLNQITSELLYTATTPITVSPA
jgi:FtsP/CotA-like multicopper oxidase with cupredoxin domain